MPTKKELEREIKELKAKLKKSGNADQDTKKLAGAVEKDLKKHFSGGEIGGYLVFGYYDDDGSFSSGCGDTFALSKSIAEAAMDSPGLAQIIVGAAAIVAMKRGDE